MAKKAIRPIRIEGNIAYVPLTRGYEAVIDAADVPLVSGVNWYAKVYRRGDRSVWNVYAASKERRLGKQSVRYMHRIIAGTPPSAQTDHIDGNGINNRRSNLRDATPSQNMHNQRISAANTSGAKGVYFNKATGKWQAQIHLGGKKHYLGRFSSVAEAAAAYSSASTHFHGEFGRL